MVVDRDMAMVDERLDSLERWRDEFESKFKSAFPHGDHVGHAGYHDLMIEQIRDRKRLIAAVKEKTISALVWSAIVGLGIASWHYIIDTVRRG